MSRSFLGAGQVVYLGRPVIVTHDLFGRGDDKGRAIKATLNWIAYNASTANSSINVDFNWENQTQYLPLGWKCRSVYIDNTGSPVPIYVYFPDTQWTVTAEPFSSVVFPVLTNQRKAWIVGQGFVTGQIPQTTIYFIEASIAPYTDVELPQVAALGKASPTITRGTTIFNSTFGAPALGDQTVQFVLPFGVGVMQDHIFNSPLPSGFIYLTHVDFSAHQVGISGNAKFEFVMESTGSAGILYDLFIGIDQNGLPNVILTQPFKILNFNAMNLQLDATQDWRVRGVQQVNMTGFLVVALCFTIQP